MSLYSRAHCQKQCSSTTNLRPTTAGIVDLSFYHYDCGTINRSISGPQDPSFVLKLIVFDPAFRSTFKVLVFGSPLAGTKASLCDAPPLTETSAYLCELSPFKYFTRIEVRVVAELCTLLKVTTPAPEPPTSRIN